MNLKWWGVLPFVLFIISLIVLNPISQNIPSSTLLISVLSTVFIFLCGLVIAYLTSLVFLNTGQLVFLWMGTGFFILAFVGLFTWLPVNNARVTVIVVAAFLASFIEAINIAFTRKGSSITDKSRRYIWLPATYCGGVLLLLLIYLFTLNGVFPSFFDTQTGNTVIKQAVNFATTGLFALAGIYFLYWFFRSRSTLFYWLSLGLLLASLSYLIHGFNSTNGTIYGWLARASLYVCGIYWLVAVISATREAYSKQVPIEEAVSLFFKQTRTNYERIVANATDNHASSGTSGDLK